MISIGYYGSIFIYADKDVLLSPFIITYNIDWYTMYTLKICRIL